MVTEEATKKCLWDGKEFVPRRRWQKYCDLECQRKYWAMIYEEGARIHAERLARQ